MIIWYMRNYGIEIANLFFDTLIGAFIVQPDGAHDMDSLSEKYLKLQTDRTFQDLREKEKTRSRWIKWM